MNRSSVLTALLLCIATTAMAQWSWVHPKSQGNHLRDVVFLDANTAIAVGDQGAVMRSFDAGVSWSTVTASYQGYPLSLATISRIDEHAAMAVARTGYIAKTIDAGSTWSVWEGPETPNIPRDAEFRGPIGLLLSQQNKLYRSDDSGVTWSVVLSGPRCMAIDFISESLVVVVADDVFLRSEDGGLTWTSSPFASLPFNENVISISFGDALHGAVASEQILYQTSDGGLSWSESMLDAVYPDESLTCSGLDMIGSSTIVASARHSGCIPTGDCSLTGQFMISTDGGTTWESEWGPRPFDALASNGNGVVVAVGSGGTIFRSTSTTWEKRDGTDFEHLEEDASAAAFFDPQRGLVTGTIGPTAIDSNRSYVLRTVDGGATWSSTKLYGAEIIDVAYSPDGSTVYAVGRQSVGGANHRAILQSLDGGATWSTLWSASAAPGARLRAVASGSNSLVIAVGFPKSVIVVDDGVATEHVIIEGDEFQSVAFADPTTAVVGGARGGIFRTTDGGGSWTSASVPPFVPFDKKVEDIAFANAQVGVAVGFTYFVRTTDGGATWEYVQSPTFGANGVGLGASGYGIAVKQTFENSPRAAETTDFGASWTQIENPPSNNTRHVSVFAPYHAMVAGSDLNVLQYLRLPVPTTITSFNADASAFAVNLTWSVRDALELDEFRVRRTEGGISRVFDAIGSSRRTFRDDAVVPGTEYEYTLIAVDRDGRETFSAPIRVTTSSAEFALLPNVPNPFNPSTTIRYVLPVRGRVRVTIYDVAGRPVTTLVDREETAGQYSVPWDGTDASGARVASGVYLLRIEAGKQTLARKMVLLK